MKTLFWSKTVTKQPQTNKNKQNTKKQAHTKNTNKKQWKEPMEKYKYTGLHTPRIPEVDSSPTSHGLLRNRSISNKHSKYFPARLLSRSQTTIERGNPKIMKTTISRELKYFIPKIPPPNSFPTHFQKKISLPRFFSLLIVTTFVTTLILPTTITQEGFHRVVSFGNCFWPVSVNLNTQHAYTTVFWNMKRWICTANYCHFNLVT